MMKKLLSLILVATVFVSCQEEALKSSLDSSEDSFLVNENKETSDVTTAGSPSPENEDGSSEEANEPSETVKIIAVDVTSSSEAPENILTTQFDQSTFSRHIYWHKVDSKILILLDFFPKGSEFDFDKKTATLPCQYSVSDVDPNIDASLNVPESSSDDECQRTVINLKDGQFDLSANGFIFDATAPLQIFSMFDLSISSAGFQDTFTGETLIVQKQHADLVGVLNAMADTK